MREYFDNSYARLPDRFYTKLVPTPVASPQVLRVNEPLARELGLAPSTLTAEVLTGNTLLPGTDPLAQVYAGHQFGGWVPSLGDGRSCWGKSQGVSGGAIFSLRAPASRPTAAMAMGAHGLAR